MVRIIIVALVVILVTAGGGYWYWTTTPQYSLEQIRDAAREHNVSKFLMYFSSSEVAGEMVKDLLASPLRKTLGGELLEKFSGMVSENTIQHEFASIIANDIKVLVETGRFSEPTGSDSDKVSMAALDQRLGISKLSVKHVKDIKVDGNIATVTMTLYSEKFNFDLDLTGEMQNRDGYWQATRITNIVECFEQLLEQEGKSKQKVLETAQ